ncbi:MAG: hypothetical protein M1823_002997 [Watsoniomyces obsoletus]|nr:MAG: hypothetical protein M1823_002997 [Watsoniomyces obsoletus]
MRWPPWSSQSSSTTSEDDIQAAGNTPSSKKPSWSLSSFLDPHTLIPTIILTTLTLSGLHLYRTYLRRIPVAGNIQPIFFRHRSLFGRVTSVGDGDNFRLFHTPGGRLAGWDWFPGRKVPIQREELKDRTIHIRLAGVDAPELAHFGRPAQPYSTEALHWLRSYVLHRRVRAYIYKRDQYDRVVATVYVRRGLLRRDVGLEMLKRGLATVYEAKTGAEFGDMKARYEFAEWWAKKRRRGMWAAAMMKGGGNSKGNGDGDWESPRDYKTRMALLEEQQKRGKK